ncbi:MAG: T9SS C-terminal target domain-containing protein, partial [Chlorobiota bacterium]
YNLNSDATMNIANNIFHQGNNTATSYIIHYPMAQSGTSILNMDWNTYYLAGIGSNFGFYNGAAVATLNDWKTASQEDPNSNYKMVNFVSATDLHLTGASNGDWDLRGMPIAQVQTDIDGNPRNPQFPYKGAHEASISLPVELTSFAATQNGTSVVIDWATATETNNMGFDVERSVDGVSFAKIGFVKGAGTTTSAQSYKFTDESAQAGKNFYRLRQIDMNGEFTYTDAIEVDLLLAGDFAIHQNYPNPFNPSTMIKFNLPSAAKVNITVFDIMGSEVANILDKDLTQGSHSVEFNASNLASGSYLYTITATTTDGKMYKESRKMQLLK